MGSGESEPAKLLLPYLQRADELQKHEPLVAYYCRLYAMERGLKISQRDRTKTTNALLLSLMNQLEQDKKSVTLGSEDHLYLEGFALNIFLKADKQDRAGRADLNTAKTFYAASIFFEIITQFGDLHPDIDQKQKYAAWKAADIRKALKEGRSPEPGPPGGDDDGSVSSGCSSFIDDSRPNDNFSSNKPRKGAKIHSETSPQPPPVSQHSSFTDHLAGHRQHPSHDMNNGYSYPGYDDMNQAAAVGADADRVRGSYTPQNNPRAQERSPRQCQYNSEKPAMPSKSFVYDCNYQPPPDKVAEAHKAARFAVGALAFDDVPVAVEFLSRSLELLTNPSADIH